jgi:WD40 repeat protein
MGDKQTCPPSADLEKLIAGRLAEGDIPALAEHLDQCRRCAETVHNLKVSDTLLEAARGSQAAGADPGEAAVEQLVQQLKGLRPDATGAATEFLAPAAGPGQPSADPTHDLHGFLAPAQGPDELGRLGVYRVLRLLGAGGMGMVYQAEDTQLQRVVALKVMKPEVAKNATARERFLREARAAARLRSDHVVTIHQVGEDHRVVFLAMEFLEGMSLEDWLKKGRRPTLAQALRIGRQIALGLAEAHAAGLIHRDIKPGNVWLESRHQGRVKLPDFGLARAAAADHQLTQSGAIVGTPAYMAPEQARGERVDQRADLFSLGVVLYRLTTGRLPFRGDNTLSVLSSLALDNPPPVCEVNPGVPPALSDLVMRLLSKDPAGRPASARAVAEALQTVEQSLAGRQTPAAAQAAPPRRGRRWLVAVAAGLAAAAALVAGIVVIIRDKQGKVVARATVPEGGDVQIQGDGKGTDATKEGPGPKEGVPIAAAPLAPLLPGEPLVPTALVQQPAKLPGVRSWTIETRDAWGPELLAYRPDGNRLAVAGQDGCIRIFEPETGRLVQVLFGQFPFTSLAWSPDGSALAAGSNERGQAGDQARVRLWEGETGRSLRVLDMPDLSGISSVAWSPDGRTVLAVATGTCFAWDAAHGKVRCKVTCHGLGSFGGAFLSPDGKRIAGVVFESKAVVLWDAQTGKELRKLGGQAQDISRAAWSMDGKRLAFTGADALYVWEAESGKEVFHCKDLANLSEVQWSPDGRSLAVRHAGPVRLVEVATEATPRELHVNVGGYTTWAPDGKALALVAGDGGVDLHDVARDKRLRRLSAGSQRIGSGHIEQFAWSPDGKTLAVTSNWQAFLASADTGQFIRDLEIFTNALAWSPDGNRLAAGSGDAVLLWEDGAKVPLTLTGHKAPVWGLAWSPDGKRLASAARGEKRVLVWDVEKAERLPEVGPLAAGVQLPESHVPWHLPRHMAWSPDGRLLAFNVHDVGWHVWDIERNKLAHDPKQWGDQGFDFAPDGRTALVWLDVAQPFRLRDLDSGAERGQLSMRHLPGALPAWSRDGRLLAVAVPSGIELWRSDVRRRLWALKVTDAPVQQIAFSGDGKLVAALAGERLHLWETDTGRLRGILLPAKDQKGLAVTPDGHFACNSEAQRGIVMVVQKDDGAQEVLEPADFERKHGLKNDLDKVHLLDPLPPLFLTPPGEPLGPNVLVREPAVLPDADAMSWTIETRTARGPVRAVAYRPDGKLLATGGDDGTIRLWDPTSGELVRMLVGGPVSSLSWSKDGKVLASGNWSQGDVQLWEAETGRLLRRYFGGGGGGDVGLSPDGRTLAVVSGNGLTVLDPVAERELWTCRFTPAQGRGFAMALGWSPDGKSIAVGLEDQTLRLVDAASGKETQKLEGYNHAAGARQMAWSPDSKRLVTGLATSVVIWDAATGKRQQEFMVEGAVRAVAWSPDGKAVAVTGGLYDPDTGKRIRGLDIASAHAVALAWSPDGKQVTMAGLGVRLLDPSTGTLMHTLAAVLWDEQVRSLALSPDGRNLAIGRPGNLLVVETATGLWRVAPAEARYLVSWSPDNKALAALAGDNTLRLWNAVTTRPLPMLEDKVELPSAWAWSADGKRLAGARDQSLWVWSVETGKRLWHDDKHAVASLAWSPDGRQLAAADNAEKGAVRFWDAETGKLLHEVPLQFPSTVAWSPDGKTLAVGYPSGQGGEYCLFDTTSRAIRATIRQHGWPGPGQGMQWAADGKSLLTMDTFDYHARVWDATDGKQLRAVPLTRLPEPGLAFVAAWSADGRVLAGTNGYEVHVSTSDGGTRGVLLPGEPFGRLAVTAYGHYRGTARVDDQIRMVVQKRDGTTETLTPADFEQKYGWKNDPWKVRLTD